MKKFFVLMLAMLWMSVAAFSQITISQEDLDDTWLTEEPISLEETKACWMWAVAIGEEVVSVEDFETVFKFSLQDLTNRWNKNVLDLSI